MRTPWNPCLAAILVGFAGVAACTTGTPSTQVEAVDLMSRPLRDIGIVPILPPSEDVRVGDVYLFDDDPALAKSVHGVPAVVIARPRWAHVPLLETLTTEYDQRPTWPKTPDAHRRIAGDPETLRIDEPIHEDGTPIFEAGRAPTRLRQVVIDALLTKSLTGPVANLLIPTEAVNTVLGTGWADRKAAILRPGSAESYSVSTVAVAEKLLEIRTEEDGEQVHYLRQPWRDQLRLVPDLDDATIVLSVVTEVYYVRTLDIAIESTAPDEAPDEDAAVTPDELTVPGEDVPESDNGDQELDPVFSAYVRAQAINDLLIARDADDTPGGFIRFLAVSDASVSLRRFWARGIAFGVRGVTLLVEHETGRVVFAGRMGHPIPVAAEPKPADAGRDLYD